MVYQTHMKVALSILVIIALGLGSSSKATAMQGRVVRVVSTDAIAGQSGNISVELDSLGNESSVKFSLNFDSTIFTDPVVSLGTGAAGATLTVQPGSGQLGISLTYPPGQTFAAGTRQLVSITVNVAAAAPIGPTMVTFGDTPTLREIVDGTVMPTAVYVDGTINIIQPNPKPTLISISPSTAGAGSNGFTLTLTGTNFIPTSVVRWNNSPRTTSFVSASQLIALIPATDLATSGSASVIVVNPGPGGGPSNLLNFTITNAAPTIVSVSPNSATVGSSDVAITVTGTGFLNNSTVRFNATDLATTFVSATQLTATIPASSLATPGAASITVFNPPPGGGASNAVPFTVNSVPPTITTLSPNSAVVGGAAFTLTVNGTGYVSGSTVQWNGSIRTTTFVSGTQLTASIPATDIAAVGTASVTVVNPSPGGGISNAASFSITQPTPAPTLTSLSPNFAIVGGPAFTLTVNGTNFTNTSIVRWNDSDRTTTFVSATRLTAAIPATDIATMGTASVKVFTPAPGGGTSNALPFFIGAQLTNVSAASFRGPQLATESIVAGFGVNLATQTQAAITQPLPTNLAGTTIRVIDSAGTQRLAPQFYVSPGQLNFQLPPDTLDGLATVVATSSDNKISVGTVQVSRVEPGVFTANANGLGVLAATILRVKPDNSRAFESIVRLDTTTNRFVSIPVDLGPETDTLFLVMYGTGFRYRSALSAVSVTLGGINAEISYAGPAPGFVGLEQGNVRIPRSLIGRSEVDFVITVDGKVANTGRLNIK